MSAVATVLPTRSPVPVPEHVTVDEGPALLSGIGAGPCLAAHRRQHGAAPTPGASDLHALLDRVDLRGRGGAGFPFATKLRLVTETRGRPVLVVNFAEGEPASAKDHALGVHRPHLVLDGVSATAQALGSRDLHVILPGDRPEVAAAVTRACRERPERWRLHTAEPSFVAGQSSAVLELMAGRPGLPVTTWTPTARRGHRARPTLLSNAETWAMVGLLTRHVRDDVRDAPATRLLTLVGTDGGHRVVESVVGARLADVLGPGRWGRPTLLGGFHGQWCEIDQLGSLVVTAERDPAAGPGLGAGVVLSLAPGQCPGEVTREITRYLASQSAGHCGPCRHGLPALADAVAVARSSGNVTRIEALQRQVDGRGACAHPDGTVRLVRSLLAVHPGCAIGHRTRPCAGLEGVR